MNSNTGQQSLFNPIDDTSISFDFIPGVIGDRTVKTINARALHEKLGVGKSFGAWIVDRINQGLFVENKDYLVCFPNLESSNNQGVKGLLSGSNKKDYHLTIDMAKHIAMLDRSIIGREIREYFIECERRLFDSRNKPDINKIDRDQLIDMLYEGKVKRLEMEGRLAIAAQQIAEMEPQVKALDRIANGDGSMCITDAAKSLGIPPRKFAVTLEALRWAYRRTDDSQLIGMSDRIASGLLEHKVITIPQKDGKPDKVVSQMRITSKGLAKLSVALAAH